MGLFDIFKRGNKKTQPTSNDSLNKLTYDQLIKNVDSRDFEARHESRLLMIQLADDPNTTDARVFLWMAKEFEEGRVYSAAAEWYKKAYQVGVKEAKEGFIRCNNPYHVNSYFNITGERGCGTFALLDAERTKEKQKLDYYAAIKKLDNRPTQNEVIDCVRTIQMIASAYGCVVPEAQVWMGDFCETVKNDLGRAAEWYKKAADIGSADGARCYADMLITGRGVQKNEEQAMKYYTIAADRGQPEALCSV